jgi:hypothetical protein
MTNTATEILAMQAEGHSPATILEYITSTGVEFCDASYLVSRVLKLDHEAQLDMEEAYN